MAAPSFLAWRARDEVDAAVRALVASMGYARSEAIRRGERVTICPLDVNERCIPARWTHGGDLLDWANGWAVVADVRAGRMVLRRQPGTNAVAIRGAAADIRFTPPAGQVIGGFRSFEIASRNGIPFAAGGDRRRCVAIAAGGRARVHEGACGRAA
jgi:type IV fimbrial biogenesis protein FimT